MTLTKEELDVELEKVNEDIQKLTDSLIKVLTDVGIEYIDLYAYIGKLDNLKTRKNKIEFMIANDI
ncbi:MAG: hypothetical protein E7Z84_08960 [Methanosphaera stadtmanae]|nr:hypothetical protein [Methanosphaera stadtmanae]